MKKKVISLMLVVLILMTGCGENKKTDFNKIGEQLKKSDAEFSNYKEVFNDFTGGKEVSNFDVKSLTSSSSSTYKIVISFNIFLFICLLFH